jgi:predicted GNAT superfamily acetyltransferase
MELVEELQRLVWLGSETDVVPAHLLLAAVHNGGLVLGAYAPEVDAAAAVATQLVGFVFGFPGLYRTPDGPRPKHASHLLGVRPDFRNRGLGFALKRAQWQMIRHQGLDLITWTFDPLLSRNAYLNITQLGAVCNTYRREEYGNMRDSLNAGLASDRFQVDWWINTKRVQRRLGRQVRLQLDLAHVLATGARILNPSQSSRQGFPAPGDKGIEIPEGGAEPILLVEIPADFQAIREHEPELAQSWRITTRHLFEGLFAAGYLVTELIHLPGSDPRSFYVLSFGESTL